MFIYILIPVTVVLPFIFRRAYGVRVLSVMILGAIALLHLTFLMTMRRTVVDDGVAQFGVTDAGKLPPGFQAAADSVGQLGASQMWLFAALTAAFLFLALLPFGILKSQPSRPRPPATTEKRTHEPDRTGQVKPSGSDA